MYFKASSYPILLVVQLHLAQRLMAANRPVRHHHFRFDVGPREPWRLGRQHQMDLGVRLSDGVSYFARVFAEVSGLHVLHGQRASELSGRMTLFGVNGEFGQIVRWHIVAVLAPRDVSAGGGVVGTVEFGGVADDCVDVAAVGVDAWSICG